MNEIGSNFQGTISPPRLRTPDVQVRPGTSMNDVMSMLNEAQGEVVRAHNIALGVDAFLQGGRMDARASTKDTEQAPVASPGALFAMSNALNTIRLMAQDICDILQRVSG